MKIKNLAFYGVMAAILGSVGTARADGAADSTIIASKGYVDAYAQKQADRVTTTWDDTSADDKISQTKYPSMNTLNNALTTVEGNIQSVATNALAAPEGDNTKLTKVSAIKGAATTSVRATGAVDTLLPTEKAVADALALKEDVANKQIAQDLSDPGATLRPWDASNASDTSYPTVKAVAQQIAAVDVRDAVQNGTNALELADAVDKAPSVTAVKGMADNTTTDYTTRNASSHVLENNGSSTKVPTTAALVGALKDLNMTEITGADQADHEMDWGKPVVSLSQVDGKVYGALGQVGTAGIRDYAVNTNQIASGAVNIDKVSAKELAGDAIDPATNQVVKWGTSNTPDTLGYAANDRFPTVAAVAQQIAAGAVAPHGITGFTGSNVHSIVKYNDDGLVIGGVDLDNTLNNINVASGGSAGDNACSAENPCVLSYIGGNTYKWTQMATEGLSARADQTSGS